MGLTKGEFAHATIMAGEPIGLSPLSANKVDAMERNGTATTDEQATIAAKTLSRIIDGSLFGVPPRGLVSKQAKPDTENGWPSVRLFASGGVPFSLFLHQRHYGGAFRQVLDATSTKRGDLIEDAVEALFRKMVSQTFARAVTTRGKSRLGLRSELHRPRTLWCSINQEHCEQSLNAKEQMTGARLVTRRFASRNFGGSRIDWVESH
jgi:hypothetical protein